MKLKNRLVSVLHKRDKDGNLAVGKVFVFPVSKAAYRVMVTGQLVRANPKPWRNKAEQKRYKKARRLARMEAAATSEGT